MAYKLPTRIFYISSGSNPLLLQFSILPINGILLLNYSLYQLYNESPEFFARVEKEFFDNPENQEVFDRLSKKLINSNKLALNEIYNLYIYLQGVLNNIVRQDLSVRVGLIFENKTLELSILPFQVMSIYNFAGNLGQNYESWKLSIYQILQQEAALAATTNVTVKAEPVINIPKTQDLAEVDNSQILNDVIHLAPSNLTIYYLSRILKSINNNLKITTTNNIGNQLYLIKLQPLYNLNLTKYNELIILNQIESITISNEEIISKSKQLFKSLNIIVQNNSYNNNIHNIYIIIYILFLYSIKINYESTALSMQYNIRGGFEYIVNKLLTTLCQMFKLNYNIQIEFDNSYSKGFELKSDEFDQIIKKHLYLSTIDKETFINSIIKDLSEIKIVNKIPLKLNIETSFLTAGSLLNIDKILQNNLNIPPFESSLLNYKLLTTNNIDELFITKPYHDLYKLYSTNIPPLDNNLHNLIKLYYQPLITILNNISNNKNNLNSILSLNNVSTLYLINNVIEPNIPNKVNNSYDILFILYQIIIPHLFHKYKLDNYIDYFH